MSGSKYLANYVAMKVIPYLLSDTRWFCTKATNCVIIAANYVFLLCYVVHNESVYNLLTGYQETMVENGDKVSVGSCVCCLLMENLGHLDRVSVLNCFHLEYLRENIHCVWAVFVVSSLPVVASLKTLFHPPIVWNQISPNVCWNE